MDRHFMDKLIFKKSNFLGLLNFLSNDFTVLLHTKLETLICIHWSAKLMDHHFKDLLHT